MPETDPVPGDNGALLGAVRAFVADPERHSARFAAVLARSPIWILSNPENQQLIGRERERRRYVLGHTSASVPEAALIKATVADAVTHTRLEPSDWMRVVPQGCGLLLDFGLPSEVALSPAELQGLSSGAPYLPRMVLTKVGFAADSTDLTDALATAISSADARRAMFDLLRSAPGLLIPGVADGDSVVCAYLRNERAACAYAFTSRDHVETWAGERCPAVAVESSVLYERIHQAGLDLELNPGFENEGTLRPSDLLALLDPNGLDDFMIEASPVQH